MTIEEEINRIKIVLIALWKYDIKQEEANKIIEQFEEDIEELEELNKEIPKEEIIEELNKEIPKEEIKDGI